MDIPLKNMLRGQQAALAQLQDEAVEIMYAAAPDAVLHGGTAIWRCYNGRRFSEDLDFYASAGEGFREKLASEALKHGLGITKWRKTDNSICARVSDGNTGVSVKIALRSINGRVLAKFRKADGSHMDIYTLPPEGLIAEKARAFASRKLIRDIYDVYFLSGIADMGKAGPELRELLGSLPKPVDEKNLRTLVYSGIAPSFKEMASALDRRVPK